MRPPFFEDGLSADDRRKVRRIVFGTLFAYTAIVLAVFAIVVARRQMSDHGASVKPCMAAHVATGAISQSRAGDCDHEMSVNANSPTVSGATTP